MIDLVQAQNDLTAVLLSSALLANVTVKSYRKMRLSQEIDYRTMLTAGRNGRRGAAIIVLMPTGSSTRPNISGPVIDFQFPIVTVEQADINMIPAHGTLLSAEEISQIAMDVVHLETDESLGTFHVIGRPMEPEKEFVFPGCISYRTTFGLNAIGSRQTARVVPPTLIVGGGLMTLTSADAEAEIRYTTDESFPANAVGGNPGSIPYEEPFPVEVGDVIRAASWKEGFNVSHVKRHVVV